MIFSPSSEWIIAQACTWSRQCRREKERDSAPEKRVRRSRRRKRVRKLELLQSAPSRARRTSRPGSPGITRGPKESGFDLQKRGRESSLLLTPKRSRAHFATAGSTRYDYPKATRRIFTASCRVGPEV